MKERGRTGKESQPEVTATSRIPSQESAGKIFSRGAVCVFLILFTKLTSSSSSQLVSVYVCVRTCERCTDR